MAQLIKRLLFLICISTSLLFPLRTQAGVIKDVFQKITGTNNKTLGPVLSGAPVCGSGVFSTPDERSLSPQIIFITNQPIRGELARSATQNGPVEELANEFRFHTENVTIDELRRNGFNPDAPVSFLMHGFTSGYPLQAWISAMVEAYTIDRQSGPTAGDVGRGNEVNPFQNTPKEVYRRDTDQYRNSSYPPSTETRRRPPTSNNNNGREADYRTPDDKQYGQTNSGFNDQQQSSREPKRIVQPARGNTHGKLVDHNLFIVNWNYAARGILYHRAVANIPIVASYVSRFINEKLIDEAGVDPHKIQLIGHSLGAHLAGITAKQTKVPLGRIYGLDPAGPCFGSVSGSLYPSSRRLGPSDAEEVISIHTNSALLGIAEPLGRYSVFVDGGSVQPGCKGGGALKSLHTLTWDGADFDQLACSHSRAPNLLTYRYDQKESDDCQLIAYECKDWDSFTAGKCGVCQTLATMGTTNNLAGGLSNRGDQYSSSSIDNYASRSDGPFTSVECVRIGLDWQYRDSRAAANNHNNQRRPPTSNPYTPTDQYGVNNPLSNPYNSNNQPPSRLNNNNMVRENNNYGRDNSYQNANRDHNIQNHNNYKRAANQEVQVRRANSTKGRSLFMKTSDSQPYCVYHYQVILELNQPFNQRGKPPMSIILQDSEAEQGGGGSRGEEKHSISDDAFGNQYDAKTYTHLLTSSKKLRRIDHATLLFRQGLADGHRVLKAIHVNYMSHSEPKVRQQYSSHLCLVQTKIDDARNPATTGDRGSRYYFKPCGSQSQSPGFEQPVTNHREPSSNLAGSDNQMGNMNTDYSSNNSNYGRENDSNNNYGRENNKNNYGRENSGNSRRENNYNTGQGGSSYGNGPSNYNNNNNNGGLNSNPYRE